MTHARPAHAPARQTSAATLVVGALVLLIAGALGSYMLTKRLAPSEVPSLSRLTFRRGEILSARFAPDGETIVYSAAWDGKDPEIFMMRRASPESKSFGIPQGDVAAISSSGEVAVLLNRNRTTGVGKLARVPLMGGQARDVLDDVLYAEWMPDAQNLAVVHQVGPNFRLEVPIGKVVLESQKRISSIRISPDGRRIAFVQPNKGQFEVVMMGIGKPEAEVLTTGWAYGVNGIAWSPDGKRLWFTAANRGSEPPSLFAVKPGEEPEMVSRLTGSLRIHDISKDGRMLLTHGTWRASLAFSREPLPSVPVVGANGLQPPAASATATATATPGEIVPVAADAATAGPPTEIELAWLDWSMLNDVSSDGSVILFSETREGGGAASSIYLRKADGSSPVRLGDGWGDSLSPDGKWVLAHASRTRLVRIPTGAGEPQPVKTIEAFGDGALWFPDGRHFLIGGVRKDGGYALYMQDTEGNEIKAITPEGIWMSPFRACAISPDGKFVAGMNAAKRLTVYPIDGSRARIVAEAEEEEIPIQWSADASAIYVYRPSDLPARVYRIDLNTGTRALWKELWPADPSGVYRISPVVISRDGSFWAYNTLRSLADLYVAEGLE